MEEIVLRSAHESDGGRLADIYNPYVLNSIVTFEETPVRPVEMSARIAETGKSGFPWIVAEQQGKISGYAYASKWKGRCAYRYSAEATVYLERDVGGRGIGTRLYTELLSQLRKMSLHAVIGGISLPNEASVALHEKFGFRQVAHFEEVGYKFGHWIDVGYWQLVMR